jgi:hypothetical protein
MTQGRRANSLNDESRNKALFPATKDHCWAIDERFNFVNCCTMHAAVTKSPLDRLFFSRFEL